MKKKILTFLIATLIILPSIGAVTYAETNISQPAEKNLITENKTKIPTIPKPDLLPGPDEELIKTKGGARNILVNTILPFFGIGLIGFVGSMSLLFLIISGVRLATTYGNDEAVQKAKDQIRYALIGLVLAILSYTIVRVITNIKIEDDTTTYNNELTEIA